MLSVGARHLSALAAAFIEAEGQARERGLIAPETGLKATRSRHSGRSLACTFGAGNDW